jgi:DNA-binding MarR family transcriptional regulator
MAKAKAKIKAVEKKVKTAPKGRLPKPVKAKEAAKPAGSQWTFLSNHTHVLLLIAKDPEMRLREVANEVGITERAVQRIVADLEEGGYLERERHGRRNNYRIHSNQPFRHKLEAHKKIGSLISLIHG